MKTPRLSLIALLAAASLFAGGTVRADDANARTDAPASQKSHRHGVSPDQRLERMARQLKLTDEQKGKVAALLQGERQKMRALRGLTPEKRREKALAIRKETNARMKKILTPEQVKQLQESRRNLRDNRHNSGGQGQAPSKN